MSHFQRIVSGASRLAAWVSGAILVVMVAHMLLEMVLRWFFDTSTYVVDEFVGYGVAAMTFLSLGYALETGAQIRVGLVIEHLRGWPRRLIEIACVITTLAMFALTAWFFWVIAQRSWARGQVSETMAEVPLWIPYGVVLLGLALFCMQLLAYLLRLLTGGDPIAEQPSQASE